MDEVRLRPMTQSEFDALRAQLIVDYAAEHVAAGNWDAGEAETLAAEQTDQLLPQGVDTPGVLMRVAETSAGERVGHLWLALERRPGQGGGAWIYDIAIEAEHRGRGHGRALLRAAEDEARRHGVTAIGLNVFGSNAVARRLYESAGYQAATVQMRKELGPAD
ncbi:MAG TPA: GNAT family N-acetyltransferase [Acidimicrobiales bacterium]|nr:GNAT family N-acetyltransferase [Acidimicrobiales bacterium]